jgi:hypothetical protein
MSKWETKNAFAGFFWNLEFLQDINFIKRSWPHLVKAEWTLLSVESCPHCSVKVINEVNISRDRTCGLIADSTVRWRLSILTQSLNQNSKPRGGSGLILSCYDANYQTVVLPYIAPSYSAILLYGIIKRDRLTIVNLELDLLEWEAKTFYVLATSY